MHFDIEDMQLFLKIASTGSLTQGAKEHARSVSAASTRLKTLENQLGAKLFYREVNGLTLTSAGQEFSVHARKIVNEYELTKKLFHRKGQSATAHLRVLANAASISEIIPDLVIALFKKNSQITIDAQPRNSLQAVKGILDHEADIGIITGNEDLSHLNSIIFSVDHLAVVYPQGHALASVQRPRLQDAVPYPFLSIYGSTLYEFIRHHLKNEQLEANFRVLLDSFDPITRLIEAGAGVAIIPESVALRLCSKYAVQSARLHDAWALRERRVVFGDLDFLSPPAQAFLRVLVEKYFGMDDAQIDILSLLEHHA